jgi:hypothetical protein
MTQTLYAYMNKRKEKIRLKFSNKKGWESSSVAECLPSNAQRSA